MDPTVVNDPFKYLMTGIHDIFEYIADISICFVLLVYNIDIGEINHIHASRKINKKSKKFYIKSPRHGASSYKVRSSPFY